MYMAASLYRQSEFLNSFVIETISFDDRRRQAPLPIADVFIQLTRDWLWLDRLPVSPFGFGVTPCARPIPPDIAIIYWEIFVFSLILHNGGKLNAFSSY